MREVITESVLLSALGGGAAFVVTRWAIDIAFSLAPASMYFMTPERIEIDTRVLSVMLVATLASGVVFGLVPAVRGTSRSLDITLRGIGAGSRVAIGRLSSGIVAFEIAMASVLLIGAALIARTFINLNAIDPGFEPRGIVTAEIALPNDRYPTPAARNAFFSQLAESLEASPAIESVAFGRSGVSGAFGITFGLQSDDGGRMTEIVGVNNVSSNYFQTARIPLIAGRTFEGDATEQVVISRSLAERLWPGRSAIGRQVRMGEQGPWQTVVGVARDVENRLLLSGPVTDQRMAMFLYVPFEDFGPSAPPPSRARRSFVPRVLIVRASSPQAAASLIRARVAALDQAQPIGSIAFGEETYADLFDRQRFMLLLMTAFSTIAVLLAAAGIFAVLSQAVLQRTREIGVRVALGATSRDILRMILSRGLALAAIGTVVGLAGAVAGARVLTSLLYGVSAYDPVSYASVAVILMVVAFVACWLPTRRAMRIEPAVALHTE